MKSEIAAPIAARLVATLTELVSAAGMSETVIACLCDARVLRDLIEEERYKVRRAHTTRVKKNAAKEKAVQQ